MGEPHVISALVAKRAELAGELVRADASRVAIRADIAHIDRVLAIFGFGSAPADIPPMFRRPPHLFKDGELRRLIFDLARERPDLRLEKAIGEEIVRRRGWDTGNVALVKAVAASVRKIKWRVQRERLARGSNIPSTAATPDA